jgi:cytosine/adenosine deaminase-related metal-dependent hydrolase
LLEGAVGSIERGRRADLVLLDRATPAFTPLNDVVTQIVHAENGRGVRTVLVDGQVVVDDGRVVSVDERRVCDAVNGITERLRAEQRRVTRIAKRLEPAWRRMVFEHQRVPLPIQRHAWPSYR